MQPKLMTSPETVVPVRVAVVVVEALWLMRLAGVVRSDAEQCQPLGAVMPVAPFMVMVTVQVPVVPLAKVPAVAPPTVVPAEHPLMVNLVAPDSMPAKVGLAPVWMSWGVLKTGLPDEPSPLVMLTWLAVPVNVRLIVVLRAVLAT